MEPIAAFMDFVMHIDENLVIVMQNYGALTYLLLFLIIFVETGLVVAPFLPGDSLLFAAGAIAARGVMDVRLLFGLLGFAAIAGDTANYWIGRSFGKKMMAKPTSFLKKEHLERTRKFYEKYGGKTIVLARFLPIIRTFAPFLAGVGSMAYPRFMGYNVIGGIGWVAIFLFGGYYFGNLQFVRDRFELVMLGIILVSLLPALVGFLRSKKVL